MHLYRHNSLKIRLTTTIINRRQKENTMSPSKIDLGLYREGRLKTPQRSDSLKNRVKLIIYEDDISFPG
jgi:hypothetical protein